MKHPTLNVGRIEGGLNINSVPDRTCFDVDIRSAPNLRHTTIREQLGSLLGRASPSPRWSICPPYSVRSATPGSGRFIIAASHCTMPRWSHAWCPTLRMLRCCCPHWVIRPVLFSAPVSHQWPIRLTSTVCSADWRRRNSYTGRSSVTGWVNSMM